MCRNDEFLYSIVLGDAAFTGSSKLPLQKENEGLRIEIAQLRSEKKMAQEETLAVAANAEIAIAEVRRQEAVAQHHRNKEYIAKLNGERLLSFARLCQQLACTHCCARRQVRYYLLRKHLMLRRAQLLIYVMSVYQCFLKSFYFN